MKYATLALAALFLAGCTPTLSQGRVYQKQESYQLCLETINTNGRLTECVYVSREEYDRHSVGDTYVRFK